MSVRLSVRLTGLGFLVVKLLYNYKCPSVCPSQPLIKLDFHFHLSFLKYERASLLMDCHPCFMYNSSLSELVACSLQFITSL